MNTLTAFLWTQKMLLERHLAERSSRTHEEGSQTTDNLLWAVAVIALAGIAVAAVTAYVNGLIGQIG